jgi:glycosyltransferase domain-containing protein
MKDFTLIIPTYNRPQRLTALLRFYDAHKVPWPILVLDSGNEAYPMPDTALDITCISFSTHTNPFDKFARGACLVTTPYAALCADDDVLLPDAIEPCLEVLRQRPAVAAVQGWAFSFTPTAEGLRFDLGVRKDTSIDGLDPFHRLSQLFEWYRAPTYHITRSSVLRHALTKTALLPNMLSKELLAAALTAIGGQIIYLDRFVHGRSTGHAVQPYLNWNPIHWALRDVDGLFWEYNSFRSILTAEMPYQNVAQDAVRHGLNMLFLRYLLQHISQEGLTYYVERWGRALAGDQILDIPIPIVLTVGNRAHRATMRELTDIQESMKHYQMTLEEPK